MSGPCCKKQTNEVAYPLHDAGKSAVICKVCGCTLHKRDRKPGDGKQAGAA